MDITTGIGLRIKEIRNEKKLTQEAVAWKAEVDSVCRQNKVYFLSESISSV